MARISFTAPERGALLAKAVLAITAPAGDGVALHKLAAALDAGNGREFDDLLVAHFRDVALEASGLAQAADDVGPEGREAAGQAATEPDHDAE